MMSFTDTLIGDPYEVEHFGRKFTVQKFVEGIIINGYKFYRDDIITIKDTLNTNPPMYPMGTLTKEWSENNPEEQKSRDKHSKEYSKSLSELVENFIFVKVIELDGK